tara:strand:+ start:972 stop:1340 length:369 start_codon:yes stop_codon:yes gene_type:complete
MKKYYLGFTLILVIIFPQIAHDSGLSLSKHHHSTGIGKYLDLSQHGVSEEYAEYLQIGNKKGLAEARARDINVNTGIDNSGEMMEGILFVYGIQARQEDLYKRITILLFVIFGLLFFKRIVK